MGGDNFTAADNHTLFKVSLTQKVVSAVSALAFLEIGLLKLKLPFLGHLMS